MSLTRRSTLAMPFLTLLASPFLDPGAAHAQSAPDPMSERSLGKADAKVTVQEWFSLTCSHCAEFQKVTFPQVQKELIDSGRVHYVWNDYPLDQVALMAAMVARSLPPERYEPFISTLLATQDDWAFARGVNSTEKLSKLAALAGMPRQAFNAAIANDELKKAILAKQEKAETDLKINSTPSFIINGRLVAGAIAYPAFLQAIDTAAAG